MDIRTGSTVEGPGRQPTVIVRYIGGGGFGQVFEGRLPDGTGVAVKTVLTGSLSPDELLGLQNEVRLAPRIQHPNVVRVLHVDDGTSVAGRPPYLVLELVTGGTLRDFINGRKANGALLTSDELRPLYEQIASGMQAVNAQIVHRDLKPENVLVDAGGVLKVADFGLAKLVGAATRSETFKHAGTPAYMAPEAFDGTENTMAMDVYAAGIIFFELAALRWPLTPAGTGHPFYAWARAHHGQAPVDLRALRNDLPHDVQQLIMLMLEKSPARRPATWDEVLRRLQPGGALPAPGGPDVSRLVERTMVTHRQQIEAAAAARAEQDRQAMRRATLELAAREPLDLLKQVVAAYNNQTTVAQLTHSESGLVATVKPSDGKRSLEMNLQIGDEIEVRSTGVARILGTVRILPPPSVREAQVTRYDPESFGGFDLVYTVPNAAMTHGTWSQYRFEHSPLTSNRSATRWFALSTLELAKQLPLLRAVGVYQHELRPLDDRWLLDLLVQLL